MCLPEKIHLFNKLCSRMSYSDADCEYNVNESTVCIKYNAFRQKGTEGFFNRLLNENVVTRGSQEPDSSFLIGTMVLVFPNLGFPETLLLLLFSC